MRRFDPSEDLLRVARIRVRRVHRTRRQRVAAEPEHRAQDQEPIGHRRPERERRELFRRWATCKLL